MAELTKEQQRFFDVVVDRERVLHEADALAIVARRLDVDEAVLMDRFSAYACLAWQRTIYLDVMAYGVQNADESLTIRKARIDEWGKKVATPYSSASEEDKRAYRKAAIDIIRAIRGELNGN